MEATGQSMTEIPGYNEATFNDMNKVATWAQDSLKAAKALGILTGNEEGNCKPSQATTRAEMSKMIVALMDALEQ